MTEVTVVDERYRLAGLRSQDDTVVVHDALDARTGAALHMMVFRHPSLQVEPGRQEFLARMRGIGNVKHRNLVTQLGLGTHRGEPYVVTEACAQRTLAVLLAQQGLLDCALACELGLQILAALAAIHQAGLTHGQLSPHAVLVDVPARGRPSARVLGFGIPQAGTGSEFGAWTANSENTVYQPPEQLMRKGFDARADLYALGAMLYEMVTGQSPFAGTSSLELVTRIVSGGASPANAANPEVPQALARAISLALEPGREQRTQTAHEFAQHIAAFVQRDPEDQARPLHPIDPLLGVQSLRSPYRTSLSVAAPSEPSEVSQELLMWPVFPKSPLMPHLGRTPGHLLRRLSRSQLHHGVRTALVATAAGSAVGALLAWIVAIL